MIGLGAVAVVVVVLLRLVAAAADSGAPVSRPHLRQVIRDEILRGRTGWSDFRILLVLVPMIAVVVAAVLLGGSFGPVPVVLLLLLALPYFAPWSFARWVAIPLASVPVAYACGWLAGVTWSSNWDRRGAAAIAGILAHIRSDNDDVPTWLRARVIALPCSAGSVLATGLLAELDGELQRAEAAIRVSRSFDRRYVPKRLRRVAADWLVTRLLARGDWVGVRALAHSDQTSLQTFADQCAAVILDREAVHPVRLWLLWALGPRRRQTRALLDRALAAARDPAAPAVRREAPAPRPAMAAHESFLSRARGLSGLEPAARPREELARAAADLEAALCSEELMHWIEERLRALRSSAPLDDVLEQVETYARATLGRLAEGVPGGPPAAVSPMALDQAFDALSVLLADLEARRKLDDRLADEAERDAWLAICDVYEGILQRGGDADHAEAFAVVWPPLCDFAVWLWNDREVYNLSNAVHRWLLHEAEAVGDERAAELARSNVECAG